MNRHKIGTSAGGVAGMQFAQDLISTHEEPRSTPVEYQAVGADLNGAPIEAGFGSTSWTWRVMPQSDFDTLLELQGDTPSASMYVRTAKRSGASGIDFANYSCIVARPVFGSRDGLLCYDVAISIGMMTAV